LAERPGEQKQKAYHHDRQDYHTWGAAGTAPALAGSSSGVRPDSKSTTLAMVPRTGSTWWRSLPARVSTLPQVV